MISFIVATYQRPNFLAMFINSLLCQTDPDFECIVMDEGDNKYLVPNDVRFKYYHFDRVWLKHTDGRERGSLGLLAKEKGIEYATGDFLCFPCEDIYYTPLFVEVMKFEQKRSKADFVHCDFIFGLERYTYRNSITQVGMITGCNWIIRKEKIGGLRFSNFFQTPYRMGISDGLFVEAFVSGGARVHKAPGCLMVYN